MSNVMQFDTPRQLPFYASIGELVFHWSRVENALVMAAKRMLDISIKEARIAMRDPRPHEILDMIEEIAIIHDEELGDQTQLADLRKRLDSGERNRNLLLHAVWLTKDGRFYVQNVAGSAAPPPGRVTKPTRKKSIKRAIFPDKVEIDEAWLQDRIAEAKACLEALAPLSDKTRALGFARRAKKLAP